MWKMLQSMQLQSHLVELTRAALLMLLLLCLPAFATAQISVKCQGGRRPFYHRGDTVNLEILLKLSPQSCLEGMKKTYVYFSGCEAVGQGAWTRLPGNVFRKPVKLLLTGGSKDKSKVTVVRNTDKESLFRQETFKIVN